MITHFVALIIAFDYKVRKNLTHFVALNSVLSNIFGKTDHVVRALRSKSSGRSERKNGKESVKPRKPCRIQNASATNALATSRMR